MSNIETDYQQTVDEEPVEQTGNQFLDESEEEEDDFISKRFRYEMSKWLSPQQLDEYLDRFTALKVNIGTIERYLIYYKRYPQNFGLDSSDPEFKKLTTNLGPKSSEGKGKWMTLGERKPDKKKEKIEVKTFENPMLRKVGGEEEKRKKATIKMANELPHNRTILAVSFMQKLEERMLYRVFGVMGKIRRVFVGELKKAKSAGTG